MSMCPKKHMFKYIINQALNILPILQLQFCVFLSISLNNI